MKGSNVEQPSFSSERLDGGLPFGRIDQEAAEITSWFLVFFPFTKDPVWRLLPGRFKNVTAMGFSKACGAWVLYECGFRASRIFVLPDNQESLRLLARWTLGSTILKVEGPAANLRPRWLGIWSVPAIRHLTGGFGAWTPGGLYRRLLAHGAQPMSGAESFSRPTEH